MLTKTFYYTRVMCVQYWPNSLHRGEQYGGVRVKVVSELKYAFHVQRVMVISNGVGEERSLTHFQFTEWPCYGTPALLNFRRMVAVMVDREELRGPTMVHCHDGGGRSWVFVLLDSNIRLVEEREEVDIFC